MTPAYMHLIVASLPAESALINTARHSEWKSGISLDEG